jgi:hypothetical protein
LPAVRANQESFLVRSNFAAASPDSGGILCCAADIGLAHQAAAVKCLIRGRRCVAFPTSELVVHATSRSNYLKLVNRRPHTPNTLSAAFAIRHTLADSPRAAIPTKKLPVAPMPVQMASAKNAWEG